MLTMLASITRGMPLPLRQLAPEVPGDVSDFVMRLIAHEPADRPATAANVVREITTIEKRLGEG